MLFLCNPCFAVFNLTATPSDGGFDLRFGRVSPTDFKVTKELTLRIISDIGKSYRVEQHVIQPLSTPDGTQIPSNQFKMYPLINSNSKGTLIYRQETPVSKFDRILYTSDGTGDNDSFKLIYTITPKEAQIPGSYYGRIAYVLVPIDSTQEQVVVSMSVYVEVAGGRTPVVEVIANSGTKRLTLSSKGMVLKKREAYQEFPEVLVKIHSPLGTPYRIYQNLEAGGVRSGIGEEFDLSNVLFSVSGGEKGMITREGTLKEATNRQLLYVSDSLGSQDEFTITYKAGKDFRMQKADLYKGKLDFIIETEKGESFRTGIVETFDLELDIVSLFDIYVFSGGVEGVALQFGEVSYKTGPRTSESEVFIDSNLRKTYQIIQKVASPMINENGVKIPPEDFTVRVKDLEMTEEPKFYLKEAAPVKEGESVIFSSGPFGESIHFKVVYELTMRPDSKAGNYSTKIGYSLVLD